MLHLLPIACEIVLDKCSRKKCYKYNIEKYFNLLNVLHFFLQALNFQLHLKLFILRRLPFPECVGRSLGFELSTMPTHYTCTRRKDICTG